MTAELACDSTVFSTVTGRAGETLQLPVPLTAGGALCQVQQQITTGYASATPVPVNIQRQLVISYPLQPYRIQIGTLFPLQVTVPGTSSAPSQVLFACSNGFNFDYNVTVNAAPVNVLMPLAANVSTCDTTAVSLSDPNLLTSQTIVIQAAVNTQLEGDLSNWKGGETVLLQIVALNDAVIPARLYTACPTLTYYQDLWTGSVTPYYLPAELNGIGCTVYAVFDDPAYDPFPQITLSVAMGQQVVQQTVQRLQVGSFRANSFGGPGAIGTGTGGPGAGQPAQNNQQNPAPAVAKNLDELWEEFEDADWESAIAAEPLKPAPPVVEEQVEERKSRKSRVSVKREDSASINKREDRASARRSTRKSERILERVTPPETSPRKSRKSQTHPPQTTPRRTTRRTKPTRKNINGGIIGEHDKKEMMMERIVERALERILERKLARKTRVSRTSRTSRKTASLVERVTRNPERTIRNLDRQSTPKKIILAPAPPLVSDPISPPPRPDRTTRNTKLDRKTKKSFKLAPPPPPVDDDSIDDAQFDNDWQHHVIDDYAEDDDQLPQEIIAAQEYSHPEPLVEPLKAAPPLATPKWPLRHKAVKKHRLQRQLTHRPWARKQWQRR